MVSFIKRICKKILHFDKIDKLLLENREIKKMLYNSIQIQQRIYFNQPVNTKEILSGFQVFSQFDEDGLLLSLFKIIGFSNRKGVEIACGDGKECNLTNLILNFQFQALLIDGEKGSIQNARVFYQKAPQVWLNPPIIVQEWVTKDNINEIIGKHGFKGEIDLFSLDVDGNDYYLFESLQIINPRVVILEAHNAIPQNLALTIPYEEDFYYLSGKYHKEFRSASILAMVKLLRKKNYRLVGFNQFGFNLIFLRNDIALDVVQEIDYKECYKTDYTICRQKAFSIVADSGWVNIS